MINSNEFQRKVTEKLIVTEVVTLEENINLYNKVLLNELNSLAPLKSKSVKIVPNAPWFDCEYENLRKLSRKAEKQYKRTGMEVHKENCRNLRKQTIDLASKKCKYYIDKIDNCPNSKTLSSVINKLFDKNQDDILLFGENDKELANSFLDYFIKKIENIGSKFHDHPSVNSIYVGNKLS